MSVDSLLRAKLLGATLITASLPLILFLGKIPSVGQQISVTSERMSAAEQNRACLPALHKDVSLSD